MRMMEWARAGLLVCSMGVVACGSDSTDSGPESFAGKSAKQMIKASEGGEVSVGAVALNVPAGALAEDTELTVDVESKAGKPDADSIAIDVYNFGPDGTEFLKPVEMEFDLSGVNLDKKDAYIAWLDGSSWTKLSDSSVDGGKITATTTHFTPFTVVLVVREDGSIDQTGGQCNADDFEACGGDVEGTWEFTAGCVTIPEDANTDSEGPSCGEIAVTADFTGSVTFADGKVTGTTMSSLSLSQKLDKQCLADYFNEQAAASGNTQMISKDDIPCEEFADAEDGTTSTDEGDYCQISAQQDSDEDTIDGTYVVEGSTLTITDSDDDEPEPQQFCVKGDEMTIFVNSGDGAQILITAKRK